MSKQGINEDLEDIEEYYGESKLSKTDKLISALKNNYSEAEFDAVATEFFHLDQPDIDRDLYNKIKAAYHGQKIKEQLGGGCRFNTPQARCYTDGSSVVAEECISTTGLKGHQGCKRNPKMMPATFASRGPTKKTMAYAKKRATEEARELEEAWNDPVFNIKFEQLGGECGYMPKSKSRHTEGTEQFGGGCRFNTAQARCYTDKSSVVAEECVSTTGVKGRQGCKRNPNMMPATFSSRGPTKKSMAYAKKRATEEAKEIEDFFNDPVFNPINVEQLGGECGLMPKSRRQTGGGCRFNVPQARCYADKSSVVAEECVSTTGTKGRQGCKRNPNMMPATFSSRYPTKKSIAYAKRRDVQEAQELEDAMMASQQPMEEELSWNERLFNVPAQEGGYWSDEGEDLIDPMDTEVAEELEFEGGEQLGGGCRFVAGPGRCFSDKSETVAPECIAGRGPKGYPSCSRREGLQIATVKQAPGYTGRKMTEAAKAKAAATRAANKAKKAAGTVAVPAMPARQGSGRTWVANPLFQEGGYWI